MIEGTFHTDYKIKAMEMPLTGGARSEKNEKECWREGSEAISQDFVYCGSGVTAVACCGVAFDTTNVSLIQAISTMHVTYGFWCACKRVTQCKEVVSVPVRQVQIPVQVDVQV